MSADKLREISSLLKKPQLSALCVCHMLKGWLCCASYGHFNTGRPLLGLAAFVHTTFTPPSPPPQKLSNTSSEKRFYGLQSLPSRVMSGPVQLELGPVGRRD